MYPSLLLKHIIDTVDWLFKCASDEFGEEDIFVRQDENGAHEHPQNHQSRLSPGSGATEPFTFDVHIKQRCDYEPNTYGGGKGQILYLLDTLSLCYKAQFFG